jgi:hypothetical protein
MKLEQCKWTKHQGWLPNEPGKLKNDAHLVLVFGSTSILQDQNLLKQVRATYSSAILMGCSTSGEIYDTEVLDDSLVVTAICFEHTPIRGGKVALRDFNNSFDAGSQLAGLISHEDLTHVIVFSDGLEVNGSELVSALVGHLPQNVTVTGGLAGDGAAFKNTFVVWNESVESGTIAILGFYGSKIRIGFGSLGGWDTFGPQRLITRSKNNVLYELNGMSALELYKKYLGEHAKDLPSSGLLFPLCLRTKTEDIGVVRTILAIDEKEKSMTFAGDVPEGSYTQFMKANFDRLIDGASGAAKTGYEAIGSRTPDLALLISCVGRKLVLKQRIEEEIESVRDVVGETSVIAGYYSYGEISPFTPNAKCELHNQTMTITTFLEE